MVSKRMAETGTVNDEPIAVVASCPDDPQPTLRMMCKPTVNR